MNKIVVFLIKINLKTTSLNGNTWLYSEFYYSNNVNDKLKSFILLTKK